MTYEEALASLIDDGIKLGAGDYIPMETLEVCKEALEKQVPKKVVYKMGCHGGALCPNCRTVFEYRMDNWKSPFCQHCGQALEWNEVEQMNNEEAIKILNTELEVRSNGYYDYLANGGKDDCVEEASLYALQLAIAALEKLIPKKPTHLHHCPNCRIGISIPPIVREEYKPFAVYPRFCQDCGQAIDWSDAE